jgi:hypothetical protein
MISRLIAAQFHRLMTSGRSLPLLCGCEDDAERRVGDYVVKLLGSVDRRESGMLCEMVASRIATHFGILVSEPSIVEITSSFAELVAALQPSVASKVRNSVGLNFGSRLLSGHSIWPVDKVIPEAMWQSAVDVFAFDALIQNPDRRDSNPNLLTQGDNICVYDHELAFSFLVDVKPSMTPWKLGGDRYLESHVFFRRLKSKSIELDDFAANLRSLREDVLLAIETDIPEAWINRDMLRIKAHLRTLREHADEFIDEVRRKLA